MFFLFFIAALIGFAGFALTVKGKFENSENSQDTFNLRPLGCILLGVGILLALASTMRIVAPGEVAVPVTFGSAGDPVSPGFHLTKPWTKYHSVSVRTEEYTMSVSSGEGAKTGDDSVSVNTKDQVTVRIDSTVIYRVDPTEATDIHVNLGAGYVDKVVRPTIRESMRAEAVNFDAVQLATGGRAAYSEATQVRIEKGLEKYGIIVEDVKIRDIGLPQSLISAIDAKVAAQQAAEQQKFELDKTRQQAEIRVTEAQGLADAQEIIQATLTPAYLQYQYIQALLAVVDSPNNSVLVLPSDPGNMPQFVLPAK